MMSMLFVLEISIPLIFSTLVLMTLLSKSGTAEAWATVEKLVSLWVTLRV